MADDNEEREEAAWSRGFRAAYVGMYQTASAELGFDAEPDNPQRVINRLRIEREAVIAKLRIICEDYGDNDWSVDDNLADVLERNLWNYLAEK